MTVPLNYIISQISLQRKYLFHNSIGAFRRKADYNYEHFIQNVSDFKLKSYYYALNESKLDIDNWLLKMVHIAVSLIPDCLKEQPIILSVDDTMTEKSGEKFEYCSVLFDHAAHNGSSYLNGHCFVSLMISVPVMENGVIQYLSIPVGYRMWTKEETKLKMAADLVKLAMQEIGKEKNVILCCDSWYPKAEITELPEEFKNLVTIQSPTQTVQEIEKTRHQKQ